MVSSQPARHGDVAVLESSVRPHLLLRGSLLRLEGGGVRGGAGSGICSCGGWGWGWRGATFSHRAEKARVKRGRGGRDEKVVRPATRATRREGFSYVRRPSSFLVFSRLPLFLFGSVLGRNVFTFLITWGGCTSHLIHENTSDFYSPPPFPKISKDFQDAKSAHVCVWGGGGM